MVHGILTLCNVACGSGIVTVNSPSGSILQCDTWLWDNMPLNSPKRPPYWNSTSGFHIHTSPQSTCHSVQVCEILSKSDHPRQKKMTGALKMREWKMQERQSMESHKKKYSKAPDEIWLSWLSCLVLAKRNSQASRPVNVATNHRQCVRCQQS